MNQLEKYNQDRTITYTIPSVFRKRREMEAWSDGFEAGSIEGFDAALALDLPVKFAEWFFSNCKEYFRGGTYSLSYPQSFYTEELDVRSTYTKEELYQYWIKNIYKPE